MSRPKAWVKFEELDGNGGRFTVSPLTKGMGVTIGNSLRRVLLSSIPGAATTSVKIEGVTHEFSTVENVVEDVLDIICNLKGIVFIAKDDEPKVLKLDVSKKGAVTAADLKGDSTIEIVNPDHHIATIADKGSLKLELKVETGVGFVPAQLTRDEEQEIDEIMLDSSYSPITRVNHTVQNVRVGKELENDELVLDVWTNGSIGVEDAVREAAQLLIYKFQLFGAINEKPVEEVVPEKEEESGVDNQVLEMSIDDLELSARSSNCLKRAGIDTVGQLIEKDMSELIQIKNFGKKSADEINGKLSQFNLTLKG